MASGIRKIGVIGMGLMGSGIAQVAAAHGFETLAMDITPEIVGKGMDRIRESLVRLVEGHRKSNSTCVLGSDQRKWLVVNVCSWVGPT